MQYLLTYNNGIKTPNIVDRVLCASRTIRDAAAIVNFFRCLDPDSSTVFDPQ